MRSRYLLFALVATLLCLSPLQAQVTDPKLQKIIEDYIEARGGHARIDELRSLTYKGKLYDEGEFVADVVIVQKQPNMTRLSMQQGARKITMAYDGERTWMRKFHEGAPARGTVIDPEQSQNLVRESDFIDPLVSSAGANHTYKLVGEEELAGIPTYVVEVRRQGLPGYERFYIGQDDHILRKRSVTYPDGDAQKNVESIYGDYENINGVSVARKTTTWIDGERQQVLEWETIEPNRGVFDSYFKEPRR